LFRDFLRSGAEFLREKIWILLKERYEDSVLRFPPRMQTDQRERFRFSLVAFFIVKERIKKGIDFWLKIKCFLIKDYLISSSYRRKLKNEALF